MRVDLMQIFAREARRHLPRPPGIIIPGWFWEEWLLVGIVIATSFGMVLVVWGTLG